MWAGATRGTVAGRVGGRTFEGRQVHEGRGDAWEGSEHPSRAALRVHQPEGRAQELQKKQ